MKPFTDEELSRILSAHEGGQLCFGGGEWGCCCDGSCVHRNRACVIQAAKLEASADYAYAMDPRLGRNFDWSYCRDWSTDRLLRWLEAQGVA